MAESNQPKSESSGSKWNDQRVERMLGVLLQTGVILSGIVVLVGGVLYLVRYGKVAARYDTFDAQRGSLRRILSTGKDALRGDGRAIIEWGLLLLIATPVAGFAIVGVLGRDGMIGSRDGRADERKKIGPVDRGDQLSRRPSARRPDCREQRPQ